MKIIGEVFAPGDGITAVVGDVGIPDGAVVDKPLVVKGKIKIGANCQILEKFLADEETKYAEVSKKGVKTVSLASALKARIRNKNLSNKVKVRQIAKKVYLEKL